MTIDQVAAIDIDRYCFDKQLAVIKSPQRYKIVRCSRRAGKTEMLAWYLLLVALTKFRANCVYISKTRESAKDIIWRRLKEIVADNNLQVKINETALRIEFLKTGSTIKIFGAPHPQDIEKRRGQKLDLAVVDECQLFNDTIRVLCDDILSIALSDTQGTLVLAGTPNASGFGYFHDKDHSEGYEKHFWTWRDNPFYVSSALNANKALTCPEDIMIQDISHKGQSITDPSVRREWFGEWIRSEDLIVYKYDVAKCDYDTIPNDLEYYVLGVDMGFSDSDAIICFGFSLERPEGYVVEQFKKPRQTISKLAAEIKRFKDKYKPFASIIDAGALGKKVQEELNFRYSFDLQAAEKDRKFEFIEFLNDALLKGHIKIKSGSELAYEMKLLTKDEEKFSKGILAEDKRYENHLCDAFLYCWRFCWNFRYTDPLPKKTADELFTEKIRKEREQAINRNRHTKNDYGPTDMDQSDSQYW